ncbi:MAG: DUF2829 domain-containing protein [Candidatus Methanomethylophilaceae archaeon]|nr:DUF2829 domain-containing protein [Candidatus Methanomethylophilaceae archaeon]
MDFGDVIKAMKKNPEKKYARKGWNGKGIYIQMQVPDEHSANTLPYIYMVTDKLVSDNPDAPRGRVPWLASQTDMLCDDWIEVAPTIFGLNRIDSKICSNVAKEIREYKYESPVCLGVADTLKVNGDLYIDHMKDCTYCIRTLGPRTYITEEEALRIAEFFRANITEAVMWDVAKRKAKEDSPKGKFDNQPNPNGPKNTVPEVISPSLKLTAVGYGGGTYEDFKNMNQPSNVKKKMREEIQSDKDLTDLVHNPSHYTEGRKFDPWDVFIDWKLDYLTATAAGYIARAGRKQYAGMTMKQSEEADLMKAIECLEKKLSVMRESNE